MNYLQRGCRGGGGTTDCNNNTTNYTTGETLSDLDEKRVNGCPHRHSYDDGPHLARELIDGGYSFANGDCQLIGKDGKMVYINRLHAAAMSQFLSIALLNTSFSESGTKQIKFPLFTSTEILDALEMSNWVLYHWIEHHTIPSLSQISTSCAFNILRVAAFFNLEHLIQYVSLLIETQVEANKLIDAFRLAEVTDAKLSERLWQRILAEFSLLYENGTYLYLSPSELEQCFFDSKFNIRVTQDSVILGKYRRVNVPGATPIENYVRKKEIERIFGKEEQQQIGALGHRNYKRIPHEIIFAHAGWGESGPTSNVEIYDYHREQWISPSASEMEESPRAYHGIAAIDKGILCMGGFNGRTYFRSTAFYDYENMHWNSVCAMVEPRCYVSLAKVDGSNIIACGGYTGQNRLRTTEIYNYNDNQWLKAGTMNFVRSDARAISIPEKNRVYIVGGFDGRQCHRTLEYYCSERDEWILEKGLMNSRRSGVGAVAINCNVIVAVGGFNGTHRLLSSEFYDIREGIWQQLSDMSLSRSNFGNACLEGDPWVIGGYNADRTIADCERLDIRSNKWIQMPPMNFSRSAVACCVVRNVEWIKRVFETDSSTSLSKF
uniref:Kelch-like protein diablo n=1 Tax=Panagrolaimus superbus TaxID=310955 RepID=A0A914Z7D0_9BILA